MIKYHHMKYVVIALALFIGLAILNSFLGGTPF